MPPLDDHEGFEQLAAAEALGALEPTDEARLEAHLADCPACRRLLAEFREAAVALAEELPAEPVPELLGARIRARAVASEGDHPAGPRADFTAASLPAARHRRPIRVLAARRPALAVAAAALIVAGIAGGVAGGLLASTPSAHRTGLAAGCRSVPGCHAVVLTDQLTHRPVATVIVRHGSATLLTHGLPADNPARDIYVLWQITGHRQPLPVGSFDVRRHQQTVNLGPLLDSYGQTWGFAISLQRGRVIPPRPSTPVALGTVAG